MVFVQLLINGVQLGALYALMAAGFSVIFGTTRIFHCAHGAAFTLAGYAFFECYSALRWPWPLAVVVAAAVTIAFGVLLDVLVYRPIKRHENAFFTVFAGSFGVAIVVQNIVMLLFGREFVVASTPLSQSVAVLPEVFVSPMGVVAIGGALLFFGGVHLFTTRTDAGIALRALSDSPELVRAYGMSPERLSRCAFALGSLLVVPAAILTSSTTGLNASVGNHVVLVSLAATIMGGVGSVWGAAAAGLLLGVAENLALAWLDPQWSEAVTFAMLLLVITFKPAGLFGRTLMS
jgi:branched-chain amino acid transport system permease protein